MKVDQNMFEHLLTTMVDLSSLHYLLLPMEYRFYQGKPLPSPLPPVTVQ